MTSTNDTTPPLTTSQQVAADALANIYTTIDELCACGCGTPLDANSRSGWFATQTCQSRWNRRDLDPESARIASPCDWEPEYTALADEINRERAALRARANRVDLRIRTNRDWLDLGNNRDVLVAWLNANGIDHTRAPVSNTIEVANGELSLDVWRLHNGVPVTVDDEILIDRLVVPLRVPLDTTRLTDDVPASTRMLWAPSIADPQHPTLAELVEAVDLTDYVVPGSFAFTEPHAGCIFPPAPRDSRNPLLLQPGQFGDGLAPVPDAPGEYQLVLGGVPLTDILIAHSQVPGPPAVSKPWWRRLYDRLTRKDQP